MTDDRKRKLEKNFFKIFFINSLLNVKIINIVSSLFYVHRNLRLAEISYLGIVFAATVIFSEVPSSYLADRFGRKKTVILATCFGILHWVFFLLADSFLFFAIGTMFYALAESFMSGTDEAIIFDTNKELGGAGSALKKLAHYFSSEKFLKIFSAFLGAVIAKDLADWQFNLMLIIDIIASVAALFFALTLVEPNHYMNVEKEEASIMKDAFSILSKDKNLAIIVFNKLVIASAAFACWRYMTLIFVDRARLSVVILGLSWSLYHLSTFIILRFIDKFLPKQTDENKINILNFVFTFSIGTFVALWFVYPAKYLLLIVFIVGLMSETIRISFFSHIFNKKFSSYNRATSLSLANFLRSIFDIPFLFIIGLLVEIDLIYSFVAAFILGLFVLIFMRLKVEKNLINYEPKTI